MADELFRVEIDEEGRHLFNSIYKLTAILFWTGLVIELVIIAFATFNYLRYRNFPQNTDHAFYWEIRIYLVYVIIVSTLFILQSYYFLKFASLARESLRINDTTSFNRSLSWMYKSLRLAMIGIILNGLYFIYSFFMAV